MNRREAINSIVILGLTPAAASIPAVAKEPDINSEYEICRQRGHVPTVEGNMHSMITTTEFRGVPDAPQDRYQAEFSTPWQTCWYCKKQYRYVTKIEEK